MAEASKQGELFDAGAAGATTTTTISVNARCVLRTEHGCRVVFVAGLPMAHFAVGDRMASAYAMVTIVEHGWADQNEVARAFECSARTVRRTQRRFEKGGLAALGRGAGYPKGRARLRGARSRRVHDLKAQGQSNRAIAARLGVTEKAVRKLLRRLGWKPPEPEQRELPLGPAGRMGADPNLAASATTPSPISTQEPEKTTAAPVAVAPSRPETPSAGADPNLAASVTDVPASTDAIEEPLPITFDTDPADCHQDRLYAHLGLLADAMPMFREGSRIPRAGVLLAMPALLDTGVLDCARHLRQHRPCLLRTAHQHRRDARDGALAHQATRGAQGAVARRARSAARTRPRTRGQDPTPKAHPALGRWTRHRLRSRARHKTRRRTRPSARLPLRRRSRARVPRQTHLAEGPRRAEASADAGHDRLLDQRRRGRSALRRHGRGQRRSRQDAAPRA